MIISFETTKVNVRSGISQRTGKPYTMRSQIALLKGSRVMGEVEIMLQDDQQPYTVGDYEIDLERSIYIGAFRSLRFNPVLQSKHIGSTVRAA